jgi:hypothetical protein
LSQDVISNLFIVWSKHVLAKAQMTQRVFKLAVHLTQQSIIKTFALLASLREGVVRFAQPAIRCVNARVFLRVFH